MEEQVKVKKCTRCGKEKPLSEFYKNKAMADGLNYYCKECINEMKSDKNKAYKLYTNPKLAEFHPRELIAELKARGYTGELHFTQKIIV